VTPRITVSLRTFAAEDPGDWSYLFDLARAADDAGVDRLVVSDHVVFGENLEAYGDPQAGGVEGGKQPTGPDGHWLEPLTVLTAVAAQTSRIRLGTYILLAALRRPVVLAKQLSTLDVISGGRVDLGVGIGWQREEYDAAGLDYGSRGRLLDESLEICQRLWREQSANYGDAKNIHMMPKPVQPGGVPIWVSGRCNERVAHRLARFGSGWIPWGDDADNPAQSIPRMREMVDAAGGNGASLSVLAPAGKMERLPEIVAAGVTDVLAFVKVPPDYDGARAAYVELVEKIKTS
jgi:probable F420-dependent oxidoreductase